MACAPSNIIYSKNHLEVRNFAIQHDKQYLAINGTATKNAEDTLHIDLNDINVSYILNLVNFHSVEVLRCCFRTAIWLDCLPTHQKPAPTDGERLQI